MMSEQYCLKWNNHQSTLISTFDSLLESEKHVDCSIAGKGPKGKKVALKAHKVVISACSPYLEELLNETAESYPMLIFPDIDIEYLKALLEYMYKGEVNVSHERMNDFLQAAQKLQIKGLADHGGSSGNDSGKRKVEPEGDSGGGGGGGGGGIKRRRAIRRPPSTDEHCDNTSSQNSCDSMSTVSMNAAPLKLAQQASSVTTKETDNSKGGSKNSPRSSAGNSIMKQEPVDSVTGLLNPKTELAEEPEENVEDLTLDDEEEEYNDNSSFNIAPGTSHNTNDSQDFSNWQLTGTPMNDEVFMAATQAIGNQNNTQVSCPKKKMASQHYCLRWNNYQSNMTSVFHHLLQTQAFVDVTLACGEQTLKAHKVVLSACSSYFQKLLLDNPCKHPTIIMPLDICFKDLRFIIEFVYKGEIDVSQAELQSLLRTADQLRIKGLCESEEGDSCLGAEVTPLDLVPERKPKIRRPLKRPRLEPLQGPLGPVVLTTIADAPGSPRAAAVDVATSTEESKDVQTLAEDVEPRMVLLAQGQSPLVLQPILEDPAAPTPPQATLVTPVPIPISESGSIDEDGNKAKFETLRAIEQPESIIDNAMTDRSVQATVQVEEEQMHSMMITPELLGLVPTGQGGDSMSSPGTPQTKPSAKSWREDDMEAALEALRSQTMSLTKASNHFGIPSTTLWQRAHRLGIDTPKKDGPAKTWSETALHVALDALRTGSLSANKASKAYGIPSSTLYKIARREGIRLAAPFNAAPTAWTNDDLERALEAIRSGQTTVQRAASEFGIPSGTLYGRCKREGIELARSNPTPWSEDAMMEALEAVRLGSMSINQAAIHYNLPYSSLYGRFKRGKFEPGGKFDEGESSERDSPEVVLGGLATPAIMLVQYQQPLMFGQTSPS